MRFIALLFFITTPLQAFGTENSNDFWFGTFSTKPITKKYSLWTEAQLRFDLDQNQMQQTLYRTGLLYSLNNTQNIGLLYAFIQTGSLNEHRLAFQHTMFFGNYLGGRLSHRLRLEARRFEDLGFGAERLRYLLRYEANTEDNLKPLIWDELFINSRKEELTGNKYIDRNRLFLGFRKNFKENNTALEFGYLNQLVPMESSTLMEHVLVAYLMF